MFGGGGRSLNTDEGAEDEPIPDDFLEDWGAETLEDWGCQEDCEN